jgi:hypothetical protein
MPLAVSLRVEDNVYRGEILGLQTQRSRHAAARHCAVGWIRKQQSGIHVPISHRASPSRRSSRQWPRRRSIAECERPEEPSRSSISTLSSRAESGSSNAGWRSTQTGGGPEALKALFRLATSTVVASALHQIPHLWEGKARKAWFPSLSAGGRTVSPQRWRTPRFSSAPRRVSHPEERRSEIALPHEVVLTASSSATVSAAVMRRTYTDPFSNSLCARPTSRRPTASRPMSLRHMNIAAASRRGGGEGGEERPPPDSRRA